MKKTLLIVMLACAAGFFGCKNAKNATDQAVAEPVEEQTPQQTSAEPVEALVKITTDFGVMTVKLYNETPQHRDNFLKLVKEGFYNDLLFHRVIQGFMIQGGDPDSRNAQPGAPLGSGGPGYTIPAEFNQNLIHKKGALSAARMGDAVNPTKASSGSQFYIVQGQVYSPEDISRFEMQGHKFSEIQKQAYTTVGGTPHLDNGYTVFGEVTEGLPVIDAIAAVKTARPGDRPLTDVRMKIELIRDYKTQ